MGVLFDDQHKFFDQALFTLSSRLFQDHVLLFFRYRWTFQYPDHTFPWSRFWWSRGIFKVWGESLKDIVRTFCTDFYRSRPLSTTKIKDFRELSFLFLDHDHAHFYFCPNPLFIKKSIKIKINFLSSGTPSKDQGTLYYQKSKNPQPLPPTLK